MHLYDLRILRQAVKYIVDNSDITLTEKTDVEYYNCVIDIAYEIMDRERASQEADTGAGQSNIPVVTAPLLNYSFRDENGEIQHCQVDAKNAEIMIGNMLEQLNKVNRFIAEFTCNGR